jgi:iron complex outermembrane recepter protein
VQMGFKYINHDNSQFSRGNRINTTDAISLSDFNPGTTPGGLYDGLHASGDLTSWPTANLGAVQDYLNAQPQGPYNVNYPSIFNVKELTRDLYTQFNYAANGFRGNVGVRYVDTTDKSMYYQSTSGSGYYLAQGKTHYYKALPSFNIAYDIDDSKVVRFGVAKVIARPRYSDLAGSVSLSSTGGNFTGSAGNPGLKPYSSTNFDLAGEWYFAPSSLLATELFYRKIGNYIVTNTDERSFFDPTTGQTNLYTITSPVNVSNAKVRGISLMYQQDLGYGFGLQTNYTYAHADASTGLNMPFLSKDTLNIIPYYEKGPWSARINYSWRSPYFTQIGRLDSHVFADQYKELDFTVGYQVNDWMGVNFSATNLLDSTYYWFNDVKYAPIGMYKNGRTYSVSLNFKL